jgi:hypothetical protein
MAFPAPSLALRVTALASEVFRRHRAGTDPPLRKNRKRAAPRAFAPLQSSRCCPWSNLDLLSWDSSGGADPITAFAATRTGRRPPLHRPRHAQARAGDCPRASTPARIAARFGPEEPSSESRSVRVVSHHLDGFLRSEVAGLLHPAAGHGVRCVSGSRIPDLDPANRIGWEDRHRPRSALHTPRRIPDCSRTTSPWPLPPCRSQCPRSTPESTPLPAHPRAFRETTTSTSRRCSAVEFGPSPTVAGRGLPCPSMGFVPLRGPSHARPASERAHCVVTTANHPKKSRQIITRLRSAPTQRPRAAGPALHPCGRRTRGRPIRRSEDRAVVTWARHAAVPRNDAAPGDAAPSVRMVVASPRGPILVRDERGRIPKAVGIPSVVHRGTAGSRSSRA